MQLAHFHTSASPPIVSPKPAYTVVPLAKSDHARSYVMSAHPEFSPSPPTLVQPAVVVQVAARSHDHTSASPCTPLLTVLPRPTKTTVPLEVIERTSSIVLSHDCPPDPVASPPRFVQPAVTLQVPAVSQVHSSPSPALVPRPTARIVPTRVSAVTSSYVLVDHDCPAAPDPSPPTFDQVGLPPSQLTHFHISASPADKPRPAYIVVPLATMVVTRS